MKVAQFLQDFFREDDEITVNCNWLQKQLMDMARYHQEFIDKDNQIKMLKYKVEKLQSRIEFMEIEQPLRLDVSA